MPNATRTVVSELLDKVPVFSLVDADGNAAVVTPIGLTEPHVEFFFAPGHAVSRKRDLGDDSLRVVGTQLGRAWLAYNAEPGAGPVSARFLADPNELAAARSLVVRRHDEDFPANFTREELIEAYAKVDDNRFNNETDVPLFNIPQLRLERVGAPPVEPWFFSLADLVSQWRKACGDDLDAFQNGKVKILSLVEMLDEQDPTKPDDPNNDRLCVPTKSALMAIGVRTSPPGQDNPATSTAASSSDDAGEVKAAPPSAAAAAAASSS